MIKFEHIEFLYGLLALPILFIIYYLYRRWRRKKLKTVGDTELITSLIGNYSGSKPFFKFILLMLSFSSLVITLANPQIGTKLEEVKRKGVELIIALDVSNSMLAEDIKPNRLDRAKQEISKLIDKLENDRIGIIVFAGKSFVQLPLTSDYAAAKLMLSTISTDIVSTQGTAIGSAIEAAEGMYSEDNTKSRALIIISDGENHEDDAVGAAKEAAEKNIIIHCVGMGTINGAPIPIYQNNRIVSFLKDNENNTVMTKLVPEVLQQVAIASNGEFYTGSDIDLVSILDKISTMDKLEFGSKQFTNYESRYQYFLGLAIFFLILELLISEHKTKFNPITKLFGRER